MLERHEIEQYFWDAATLDWLCDRLQRFVRPCCLCAPMLGRALVARGVEASTLDIDDRFGGTPNFVHWDVYRPSWLGVEFDVIVCDPPFWKVSLSQLFRAIRLLSRHDYAQPLLLSYPQRRAANVCGTFARFDLQPAGRLATYLTVRANETDPIEFFANWQLDEASR